MKKRVLSFLLTIAMLFSIVPISALAGYGENKNIPSSFMTSPYLLAPKTDGMVVAWELASKMKSSISYGTSAENLDETLEIPVEEGEEFKDTPMYMYRATLKNLKPNTMYYYEVKADNEQSVTGSFTTLPENPEEIRFIVVSDTHRFETAQAVAEVIDDFKPHFILHTGDMVEGTGIKKDQFAYWFLNAGDFLRYYPVIYNHGNHDHGPYFDEYIVKSQAANYKHNMNGHNISYNVGDVHFTMVNSNPWSLLEMNAAGKENDDTRKLIDESLAWLKEDLASEDATKAKFRVLTMHHPYEDDYTRKYIPEIAEAGNVNIMFSGHTHLYSRLVSVDPAVGANTVYITQGDARIGDGKVNYGTEERIKDNFPNLIAEGKGDMLKCTYQNGVLECANVGLKNGEETEIEKFSVIPKSDLSYEDISIKEDSILSSGKVTVSAKVTNTGKGFAAATFPIDDNGTMRYIYLFGDEKTSRIVELQPGHSKELTGELELTDLGVHTLKMADYTKDVTVNFRKATYEYSDLSIKLGEGDVSDLTSDILNVKATVKNIGNESGKTKAELKLNGKTVDTLQVTLDAGQSKVVEFVHQFTTAGDFTVAIGNTPTKNITILGKIQGVPIVKDQSGNGNDGLIRGNPKLITYNDGEYGLALDGVDDYVEIPDNLNYTITDGVSGMVWANVQHLADDTEEDHHPLLVKGASCSYGTNYLWRMIVRRTGMISFGVGFDNENGEYFWDDTVEVDKVNKWVQYTGAFDRETGGIGWENTTATANVDKPEYDSDIKNWEGSPMYIGYSYHRHLLENRNRGKTFTTLQGEVGQVRFYDIKLTAEENEEIYNNPTLVGPQQNHLKIWLDYNPANIVTEGTHTTEWRAVKGALKTLDYETEIGENSKIVAKIELSDDKRTVAKTKEVVLENGSNQLDISDLGTAKYIRVASVFTSSVGAEKTTMPVLKSYKITAGNENVWGTLAAWNKGEFEAAVGYEPTDTFKIYTEDFDDYSAVADVSTKTEKSKPSGGSGSTTAAYTLTFQTNGGTAVASVSKASGTTINLSDYTTKKEGYTFDGWYSDAELTTKVTSITLTSNATVYSKWTESDAKSNAYISGYTDGTFRPDGSITRAEAAQLLYNISGQSDAKAASTFRDVSSSDWYYKAVSALSTSDTISGYADGTFRPSQNITRAEFAALIAKYKGLSTDGTSSFQDVNDHWAAGAIEAVHAAGLVNGYSDGTFKPSNNITRAEVVTILNRMLNRDIDSNVLQNATMPFSDVSKTHWAYDEIVKATI